MPDKESGVIPEHLLCAMLVGGFASGSYQYESFSPSSAVVKIDWNVSRNEQAETFQSEFEVTANKTGSTPAGNGNTFDWSFLPVNLN